VIQQVAGEPCSLKMSVVQQGSGSALRPNQSATAMIIQSPNAIVSSWGQGRTIDSGGASQARRGDRNAARSGALISLQRAL
jgi:hypothetical protein